MNFTTWDLIKMVFSCIIGTAGAYMLYRGKKTSTPRLMVIGGVLLVLSYILFS
jgi:L,D-peptidoglycan transpeptidase YkuD (ErfK/YbiS/YcfS/YnhG family)